MSASRHNRIWPLADRRRPLRSLVDRIVRHLATGGPAIVPTDTLYALTCDATNAPAVSRVAALKGGGRSAPFSIFLPDATVPPGLGARLDARSRQFADSLWPGRYTLVLPLVGRTRLAPRAVGPGRTVGIRVSAEEIIRRVGRRLNRPLIATSANPTGRVWDAAARNRWFSGLVDDHHDVVWVKPRRFVERPASAVVDLTGTRPRILRGELDWKAIADRAPCPPECV